MADVGCDHGYLGIHLLQEGTAAFVAALDLRSGPLAKARQNAVRFGMADRMFFAVCDGLEALEAGTVDTVVCAGMGGDTIAKILDRCPWAGDERLSLILQPQSSGNDLRRWLGENGFSILREPLVRDGGFLYTAFGFTGTAIRIPAAAGRRAGAGQRLSETGDRGDPPGCGRHCPCQV